MIGKRYSAQYKIQIVEAYLTENEKNKISIAQFAHNNGISDSTEEQIKAIEFNDGGIWLYQKEAL